MTERDVIAKGDGRTFADTAARGQAADEAWRSWARRRDSLSRLVGSADFRDWLFDALVQLCAFGDDLTPVDGFNAGKRAAAAYLRRTLLAADGAPQFLADLDRRYYEGVRRGMDEAIRKNTNHEGNR